MRLAKSYSRLLDCECLDISRKTYGPYASSLRARIFETIRTGQGPNTLPQSSYHRQESERSIASRPAASGSAANLNRLLTRRAKPDICPQNSPEDSLSFRRGQTHQGNAHLATVADTDITFTLKRPSAASVSCREGLPIGCQKQSTLAMVSRNDTLAVNSNMMSVAKAVNSIGKRHRTLSSFSQARIHAIRTGITDPAWELCPLPPRHRSCS